MDTFPSGQCPRQNDVHIWGCFLSPFPCIFLNIFLFYYPQLPVFSRLNHLSLLWCLFVHSYLWPLFPWSWGTATLVKICSPGKNDHHYYMSWIWWVGAEWGNYLFPVHTDIWSWFTYERVSCYLSNVCWSERTSNTAIGVSSGKILVRRALWRQGLDSQSAIFIWWIDVVLFWQYLVHNGLIVWYKGDHSRAHIWVYPLHTH